MYTNNIVEFPICQQADISTFNLVSELLAEVLTDTADGEALIIESRSQEFFYDPETNIATEPLLKATIDYEDVAEMEDKINVNLFGTVEGLQGKRTEFTLYFWMWCNDAAKAMRKNYSKTLLRSNPVEIELSECLKGFSNTVFELELYGKNETSTPVSYGHGRGFLIFDEVT